MFEFKIKQKSCRVLIPDGIQVRTSVNKLKSYASPESLILLPWFFSETLFYISVWQLMIKTSVNRYAIFYWFFKFHLFVFGIYYFKIHKWHSLFILVKRYQGCALAAPGRLRRLTFGLGRLKKKSGRPSGCIDFGLCENLKRNQQTYRNGTERNKKKLHRAPWLPLARKATVLKAQCNQ